MGNINMHNLKRAAAIKKYNSLKGGELIIVENHRTWVIVENLRKRGYIYKNHKFVKIYGAKK